MTVKLDNFFIALTALALAAILTIVFIFVKMRDAEGTKILECVKMGAGPLECSAAMERR